MVQYILRYSVRIGNKYSERLRAFEAPNDYVASEKAQHIWRHLKELGIVPFSSQCFHPQLFCSNRPVVCASFNDSD